MADATILLFFQLADETCWSYFFDGKKIEIFSKKQLLKKNTFGVGCIVKR